MICFYHNDADGRAAAAIVRKYAQELHPDIKQRYIEVDYDQQNVLPAEIMKNEVVFIVDFHFTPNVMKLMCEVSSDIYVFDHHKTGKEVIAQYPKEVECHCDPGNKFAGCELVWNFLYPTTEMPRAVKLIADHDKWAWKFGEMTAQFNEGLKLYSHQPKDLIWSELLSNHQLFLDEIIREGKTCLQYRDRICKEFRNDWGFEVEFMGYRCYVMNLRLKGSESEMFAEKLEEYDICISIVLKNGLWKISLRSNGKVDVSEFAKKFVGGGGHANAAGANGLKELPFKILKKE